MNSFIDQLLVLYITELNSVRFKFFNILRVIKQMQILSLWMDIQSSNIKIIQGSFLKFIAQLFRFARFSITDYNYIWILVFLTNMVLLGFYPMSIIFEKYFRRQNNYSQSHKSLFNIINIVMSSYQFVFMIPFISISLNRIQNNLIEQEALIVVFNLINVLFIIIIITIIHLVIGSALEVLKQDSILLYKLKIDYLEFPIQILLVILTLSDSQTAQMLSTIITSLYFFCKLYTLTFHFQQNTSHRLEILIICFNLYTIFSISLIMPYESSLILLNFPLSYHVIILLRERQIQQCCLGNTRNVKQAQFRQIYLLQNQNIICRTIKINYILKHQQQCLDLKCQCNHKLQDKAIILMNQEFYQLIKDERKNKLMYFQHYVSFLINLDQSPKAINFLRKFIFDDQLKQKSMNSQEVVGRLDRIKFQILLQKSLQILSQETDSSATKEQLSISIQQFLNQEEESNKIINCVEQSIYLKFNFLTQIGNQQNMQTTFNRGQIVISKIMENMEFLQSEYKQFQSVKLQSALSFLYAEVICNNFRAYQITQFGLQNNQKFVFSNEINYLKIYVNDQLEMFIKFRSHQCYQLFGYQQEDFLSIQDAQILLPQNFTKIHKRLLFRYFETGKSKFYKESNVNLIKDQDGFLKQVDFFFDIQQSMNFIIVCFFKEIKQTNGIILVNHELKICGVNRYFLSQLGIYTLDLQNQYQKQIYDQSISCIIPDFENLDDAQQSTYIKINNYEQSSSNNSKHQRKLKNQIKMRTSLQKFCIEEYHYYIIYLDSIFTEQVTIYTNLEQYTQQQIEDIPLESPPLCPLEVDHYQMDNLDNIVSPKNSVQGFIKSQYNYHNDQIFFTSQIKSNTLLSDYQNENKQQSQNYVFLKQSDNNANYLGDQNNNDQNEINSQISSVAGFKRSKYYKLYDLLNRLVTGKKKQYHFQIVLVLYFIILIIALIYCVIILYNSITDLNRFVYEIDMLSIKSQFYGPLINYQVALLSVGNYYKYLIGGLMNLSQIMPLWSYDYYVMNQSYQILKQSYININSNSQIMRFVQQQSLDIHMQVALNQIEDRFLNLDQVINQLYFNAHLFSKQDISKYTVNGTNWPEVTFYMTNMIEFYNKISNMINDIRQYSLNRADLIYEKWYIYQIVFTISIFALQVSCVYMFHIFINQLQFITSIVNQQDIKSINFEIKRLKFIHVSLKSDPQQIFNYKFNMEQKDEQFQLKERQNHLNQDRSYRDVSHKDRLPLIFYIITNLVILGIFLSYCIIINVQVNSYLTMYKPSVDFYIKICNQSTSASGSFAAREIIYQSNEGHYYFMKPDNISQWKNIFMEQMSQTYQFNDTSDYLDQNNILATSEFISEFNKIKQGSLCQLLSVEEMITAQYHCKQDYNGILERGLLITTNTINNMLLNEYQINNFQNHTLTSIQEIEIGLIIYSALRNIIDQFKNNLSDVTKYLQNQILIITSIYICFIFIKFIILFRIFSKYYNTQYYRARNMIFLVNQEQLFNDNNLERRLRQYMLQNDLL